MSSSKDISGILLSTTLAAAFGGITAWSISKILARKGEKETSQINDGIDTDSVVVTLPKWANDSDYFQKTYNTDEEKMSLAIELSSRNIEEQTGGPFGTAIFRGSQLVAVGMNRVVTLNNCTLHGETVAIQMAQKKIQTYTFQQAEEKKEENDGIEADREQSVYELFTSCEPCAMCIGAVLWSGVGRLVCAAAKDDATKIGFDEGPVFEESYTHLEKSGIIVNRNVMREEAASVLKKYGEIGVIYNR